MGLLGASNPNMMVMYCISGELMGTETLSKLRSEALMLPEAERAELAHALVKSLDAPADADAADAWDKEILCRLAEIDAGTAKLIDRDEFRRRMQERLGRR
ncbi:MAG: addiction module protein [Gammaproteobacteria bacterium]